MRIVSWNFLEGGLTPSLEGYRAPQAARRQAAVQMMVELAPDVLILNEALFAETWEGQCENYAALFGFEYQAARLYDKAWGNAILSRWPIVDVQARLIHRETGQNRGWLAALTGPEGRARTWVSTYHPHPQRRPHMRAADFHGFLTLLQGQRAVLCGDLNAINPADAPNEASLLESFLRFQSPAVAKLSVSRMLESGRLLFEDVLPAFAWRDGMPVTGRHSSLPTALTRRLGDEGLRIDHALISPDITVLGGEIALSPLADLASDHYPLVLDIAEVPLKD
jgi:endonuclease/exonuclease/phosphatase family metal-dependent hydrolase